MSARSYEFHAAGRTEGSFDNLSRELQEIVSMWHTRARQRRQLARLDAVQLADIGLTRAEAMAEANKPFWQR